MRVTAIVTTFNRAELLLQAVQSILNQTRPADQLLIIDDGSTDDTAARLQSHAADFEYVHQPQQGVSAARNTGIRLAKHEWIGFLDSDDLWQPQKLARQLQALANQKEYLLCYTDEEWRRHGQWMNQGKKHRKYSGWIYLHCLPLCIISPSSVLMHRRVFDEIGLFDESLPACEDYDLWLRVTSRFPALFIPERLIIKRAGDWPQLSQQHSLDRYRIIALDKMLKNGRLNETQRRATMEMLEYKCRLYAQGCRKHGRFEEANWAMSVLHPYLLEVST